MKISDIIGLFEAAKLPNGGIDDSGNEAVSGIGIDDHFSERQLQSEGVVLGQHTIDPLDRAISFGKVTGIYWLRTDTKQLYFLIRGFQLNKIMNLVTDGKEENYINDNDGTISNDYFPIFRNDFATGAKENYYFFFPKLKNDNILQTAGITTLEPFRSRGLPAAGRNLLMKKDYFIASDNWISADGLATSQSRRSLRPTGEYNPRTSSSAPIVQYLLTRWGLVSRDKNSKLPKPVSRHEVTDKDGKSKIVTTIGDDIIWNDDMSLGATTIILRGKTKPLNRLIQKAGVPTVPYSTVKKKYEAASQAANTDSSINDRFWNQSGSLSDKTKAAFETLSPVEKEQRRAILVKAAERNGLDGIKSALDFSRTASDTRGIIATLERQIGDNLSMYDDDWAGFIDDGNIDNILPYVSVLDKRDIENRQIQGDLARLFGSRSLTVDISTIVAQINKYAVRQEGKPPAGKSPDYYIRNSMDRLFKISPSLSNDVSQIIQNPEKFVVSNGKDDVDIENCRVVVAFIYSSLAFRSYLSNGNLSQAKQSMNESLGILQRLIGRIKPNDVNDLKRDMLVQIKSYTDQQLQSQQSQQNQQQRQQVNKEPETKPNVQSQNQQQPAQQDKLSEAEIVYSDEDQEKFVSHLKQMMAKPNLTYSEQDWIMRIAYKLTSKCDKRHEIADELLKLAKKTKYAKIKADIARWISQVPPKQEYPLPHRDTEFTRYLDNQLPRALLNRRGFGV